MEPKEASRAVSRWVALFLALSAVGCGHDPYGGKIPLRYMAWGNPEQMALEKQFCEEFNQRNPDVHVSFLEVPQSAYSNKAVVMFASRTAPDVVRIDHFDFPSLVRKGYFYDLAKLAANDKGFQYGDFVPLAMQEARYKGGFYGLNVMFGAEIMYYNKSMVREAGLEDPYVLYKKGRWTWERFRSYAIAMTRRRPDGRTERFGCAVPLFPMNVPVIWSFGGELLTADGIHSRAGEPGCVRAYQLLADLRWRDHSAPTPAQESNSGYTFESGQIGMVFNWMGMAPRYRTVIKKFDWDVCPMPKGPYGGTTIVKGNQLVVYRESAHPEAAWRFTRFLTSPEIEQQLYVVKRRNFPTRKGVANSPEFLHTTQPPFQTHAFLEAVADSRPLPIGPRWSEWTLEVRNAEDDIYSGRSRDAAHPLRDAQARIDAVFADEEGY